MNNFYTDIYWQLSNYCKAECSYCPIALKGGEYPEEDKDYVSVTSVITEHYNKKSNRKIRWEFDGGEPLDLMNLVRILKTAKADDNWVSLNTSGGSLWLDWFAIEPAVDKLILTYHYWQQHPLIKYIIETFQKNNKEIFLKMPVRPTHFEEDMDRVQRVESEFGITVSKMVLYKQASNIGGMFDYNEDQLWRLAGIKVVKEKQEFETKTYHERLEENIKTNPSYLGKLCNAGIEKLIITHSGHVTGSNCRNESIGYIWSKDWRPPDQPQVCGMLSCMDWADQQITKFT